MFSSLCLRSLRLNGDQALHGNERYTVFIIRIKTKLLFNEKSTIVINLKGKTAKAFRFLLKMPDAPYFAAHLLVEIPLGFELLRNRSIQL